MPSKKELGQQRKKDQKLQKDQEEAAKLAKAEEEEWKKGANVKGAQRQQEAGAFVCGITIMEWNMYFSITLLTIISFNVCIDLAAKADEAARRRREKEELLKEEESQVVGNKSAGKVKKVPTLSKKSKKKQDDLSLLEDALVKSAEKSTRQKKRAQEEKKQAEQQRQLEKQQAQSEQQQTMDPLLQNTEDMLDVQAGRAINRQIAEEGATSGLDAGLASLSVSVPGGEATKSQKQLYKEFEQRMLPILKEDYPGLRLSQYQEKIFAQWKKSPENPQNIPS